MEKIIDAIDKSLLRSELNETTFLRDTVKAGNEIYVVNAENAPNVLREIGRLREISFREMSCGSGTECDLDHFDLEDKACYQLVVWNPEEEEIIGGYRFTLWSQASFFENGQPYVNTEHLFTFSQEFIDKYFRRCIEMARAFVQPKYQSAKMGRKSLYALDNLWDGIGALVVENDVDYLVGKVTMYKKSPEMSRKAMIYFMDKFFGNRDGLLVGKNSQEFTVEERVLFDGMFEGGTPKENYKRLSNYAKSLGDVVPPFIHLYMDLSPTMQTFGTVYDPDFGDAYDTFLMITLADVYPEKVKRYIDSYREEKA